MVGVIKSAEEGVIALEIRRQDIGVCSVEIIEDGTGGGGSVSHVFMTEGTDEHLIHGGKDNFAEGLVSAIILIEELSSNVVCVEYVGKYRGRGPGLERIRKMEQTTAVRTL